MATIVEAEKYIFFLLSNLGGTNGHHIFEDVCTRVARRRISSNILLSTGPVSAGGDQGRDAESFHTRLPKEIPGAGGFVAAATTDPVVVACTLQKNGLAAKVRSDVDSILTAGEPVAHIAYFCSSSVPAAVQHRLQAYTRDTYQVTLDVFDGPKLATLLAERDLVWVAESFLDLPGSVVPDYESDKTMPAWYSDSLATLRSLGRPLTSAGDLTMVRAGLRHATFDSDARVDLPEWIAYAAQIAGGPEEGELAADSDSALRARYEIVVATLRGLNTMNGVEPFATSFLAAAESSNNPALLQDASVLLMYCGGAWARHLGTTTAGDLENHLRRLRTRVDVLIAETDPVTVPTKHARLLAVAAHLYLHPAWGEIERPAPGRLPSPLEISLGVQSGALDAYPDLTPQAAHFDIDEAMSRLAALADQLPRAPGLPIEQVCDLFDLLTPALATNALYSTVRDALDSALSGVEGDSAAALRSRNRGVALWRAEQPLNALRELHDAKIRWYHGDTMRGSILTMLFIGRIYHHLGLPHAAKQYALAAATIALASGDVSLLDLIPRAFLEAATHTYTSGAWMDTTAMADVAILAHAEFAERAFDADEHPDLESLLYHQAVIGLAARRFRPDLSAPISAILARTGYDQQIEDMVDQAEDAFALTEETFLADTDEQIVGRPFSDTGPQRHIRFSALGTSWHVTCNNSRALVLSAERFAAAAQILIADIAPDDPVFFQSRVIVEVSSDTPLDRTETVRFRENNEAIECTVYLTEPLVDIEASVLELTTTLTVLLSHVSALANDKFMNIIEQSFANGLTNKLMSGRPYDELADLFSDEHYDRLSKLQDNSLGNDAEDAQTRAALAAPNTHGPGYDHDAESGRIRYRYDTVQPLLNQTIPRILASPRIRAHLHELREQGWLDWQLVIAIHSIALNARSRREGVEIGNETPQLVAATRQFGERPEGPDSEPIPLEFFNRISIETQLEIGLLLALRGHGLQSHLQTPDFRGIRNLLRVRYEHTSDDEPHLDLLQ